MDEELPFNMRTPAIITPKPNVPKPKFKPSRQNVETLINILRFKNDGTQFKLPPEVTQPFKFGEEVLPPVYERLIQQIQEKFDGAKSDFDDLLLEAALPCKRFWFEKGIIRDNFTVRVKSWKESIEDGTLNIEDANDLLDSTVNASVLSLIVPIEQVEGYILKNKDGVGIGVNPGESLSRPERPICAEIVTKVGEALNDPKNQGRNSKVVRREVWNSLINKQYGVGRFLHRKHPRLTKKAKKVKKGKTRKYIR